MCCGSIGDHLRKHRLDLGFSQRRLAKQLGVNPGTMVNWERNATTPALRLVPRIIHFIGCFPLAPGHFLPEKLKVYRRPQDLSQKELAGRLGVDESTVGRWERGRRDPWREPLERAQTLL